MVSNFNCKVSSTICYISIPFFFVLFRTERNDGNPYKSSNLVIGYVYFLIETVVEVEGFIPEMIKIIIIELDQ